MQNIKITPSNKSGKKNVFIPSSKSQSIRALTFALMTSQRCEIRGLLQSADVQSVLQACKLFGARHEYEKGVLVMYGGLKTASDVVNVGNSGLFLRFATALGSLLPSYTVITGDHSIRGQRPSKVLLKALKDLGAFAESSKGDGFAPVIVKGPLRAGACTVQGEDSQPISALLIALSFLPESSQLHVRNPGEIPWIEMTLGWFRRLGIDYVHRGYEHYEIAGKASYEGFQYVVPGDFSSAAFPLAFALMNRKDLVIDNLQWNDLQGDKELFTLLQSRGASIEIDEQRSQIIIKKTSHLKGGRIDMDTMIDALPILSVIGCCSDEDTELYNVGVAMTKECNRVACITQELRNMGAYIECSETAVSVRPSKLRGARVSSHKDHRMAMALAIAATVAEGSTIIEDVECVQKTYPHFFQELELLGVDVQRC